MNHHCWFVWIIYRELLHCWPTAHITRGVLDPPDFELRLLVRPLLDAPLPSFSFFFFIHFLKLLFKWTMTHTKLLLLRKRCDEMSHQFAMHLHHCIQSVTITRTNCILCFASRLATSYSFQDNRMFKRAKNMNVVVYLESSQCIHFCSNPFSVLFFLFQ